METMLTEPLAKVQKEVEYLNGKGAFQQDTSSVLVARLDAINSELQKMTNDLSYEIKGRRNDTAGKPMITRHEQGLRASIRADYRRGRWISNILSVRPEKPVYTGTKSQWATILEALGF